LCGLKEPCIRGESRWTSPFAATRGDRSAIRTFTFDICYYCCQPRAISCTHYRLNVVRCSFCETRGEDVYLSEHTSEPWRTFYQWSLCESYARVGSMNLLRKLFHATPYASTALHIATDGARIAWSLCVSIFGTLGAAQKRPNRSRCRLEAD